MGLASLEAELKQLIIETLELEDITVDDINSEEALFNDGLGLDSIDALELGVALHNRYGIKLESESEENRQFFASISALAAMVDNRRVDKGDDDAVA
ncbi:MAG: phosphopantetheine-binding protein [Pseudomonadales bacterium]